MDAGVGGYAGRLNEIDDEDLRMARVRFIEARRHLEETKETLRHACALGRVDRAVFFRLLGDLQVELGHVVQDLDKARAKAASVAGLGGLFGPSLAAED